MTSDSPEPLRFLPVGLDLQGRSCLVVGGGSIGTRKVQTLLRAGAVVTIVSPKVSEDLAERIQVGRVRWVRDSFREEHLGDAFFVVAATNDETQNAAIVQNAARHGALVCDASSAERSQVIFGALHVGDDVTIAVFTDGRDPAHARRTRDQIAAVVAPETKTRPSS